MKIKRFFSIVLVLWSIFYVVRQVQFLADDSIVRDNNNLESILLTFLFHALLIAYVLWTELNDKEKRDSHRIEIDDVFGRD